jgi:hypothetical protein
MFMEWQQIWSWVGWLSDTIAILTPRYLSEVASTIQHFIDSFLNLFQLVNSS